MESTGTSSIQKDVQEPEPKEQIKLYNEMVEEPTEMFFIEKIIDWDKRIAAYSNAIKAKYKEGIQKFEELK